MELNMMSSNIFKTGKVIAVLLLSAPLFSLICTSCKEEDAFSGKPYFTIEGNPTGLSVEAIGISKSYTVRSNRPWEIVAQDEGSWVRAFPSEGLDDGIFKFIVENNIAFEPRVMNFAILVNGEEQPVFFRVEQKANVPFIVLQKEGDGPVPPAESEVTILVNANLDWTYSLDDPSWLTELEVSGSTIKLLAGKNSDGERSATLTVHSAEYPEINQLLVITQLPGNIILNEDFSWLTYGSAIPYVTSGEVRYDVWTQDEKDHGWYSTPNTAISNQRVVYARQGFVKLGRTNYGGDLISPKLNIEGTATVKVTFKAAAYISASGNVDDNILNIFAVGAGTPSISQITIDNIPNSEAEDNANVINNIWAEDRAYSFTISDATADTQIRFLAGDFELSGVGQGKNRIFLDDIRVEIVE